MSVCVSFYWHCCSCLLPVLDIHAHHSLSYNFGVSILQLSLLHSYCILLCHPNTVCHSLSPLTFISEFHCCHCQILHSNFIPYNRHPFLVDIYCNSLTQLLSKETNSQQTLSQILSNSKPGLISHKSPTTTRPTIRRQFTLNVRVVLTSKD